MSKHHRKHEGDLHGRDVGLIGERHEKVAGYESPMWEAVNKMVEGHMPTTNLGTIAAGSHHGGHHRSVEREQRHMVEGKHEKHGGHMKHMKHEEHPRHKKHHEDHMSHGGHAKHHKKHMAAGGVGKVRKGEY
jgi:hypothetical protein